jgi:hypothetical protein
MNEKEQTESTIDTCLRQISLIESSLHYCANKDLGKMLGVYDGAAKQIMDLMSQLRTELSRLKRRV